MKAALYIGKSTMKYMIAMSFNCYTLKEIFKRIFYNQRKIKIFKRI